MAEISRCVDTGSGNEACEATRLAALGAASGLVLLAAILIKRGKAAKESATLLNDLLGSLPVGTIEKSILKKMAASFEFAASQDDEFAAELTRLGDSLTLAMQSSENLTDIQIKEP